MRDYGKVSPKFWIGQTGKALRKQGMDAQMVALYLLTSPHSSMLGLYTLPVIYIAHETGLGMEGASKGLRGCIEAGFCQYDEDTEMVWVIEMAHYQIADKLNVRDKQCLGVQKAYNELIENPFLSGFYEKYATDFNLTQKRGGDSPIDPPPKALTEPLGSQEQEQEQEQEQKPKPSSSSGDDGVTPFEKFWEAYPWNAGKQDAQRAWIKVEKNWAKLNKHSPDADMLSTLLDAITAQLEGADWKRDNGQYIPRAATWLNGGRWLDEVRPYVAPAPRLPPGWWETHESLKAAGLMLNPPLTPRTGEMKDDFRRRINQAIGVYDKDPQPHVVEAPQKIERPYVPPTVPEGVQLTPEQLSARKQEFREQLAKLKQVGGLAVAGVAASNEKAAA